PVLVGEEPAGRVLPPDLEPGELGELARVAVVAGWRDFDATLPGVECVVRPGDPGFLAHQTGLTSSIGQAAPQGARRPFLKTQPIPSQLLQPPGRSSQTGHGSSANPWVSIMWERRASCWASVPMPSDSATVHAVLVVELPDRLQRRLRVPKDVVDPRVFPVGPRLGDPLVEARLGDDGVTDRHQQLRILPAVGLWVPRAAARLAPGRRGVAGADPLPVLAELAALSHDETPCRCGRAGSRRPSRLVSH